MRRPVVILATVVALLATGATVAPAGAAPNPPPASTAPVVQAFPAPGTAHATPGTSLSFRGLDLAGAASIAVRGESSGAHPGTAHAHRDGGGVTFTPSADFTPGEAVTVSGVSVAGGEGDTYSFGIGVPAPHPGVQLEPGELPATNAAQTNVAGPYVTRPDLLPPVINVTTPATDTSDDLIFSAPYTGPTSGGPMIFDDTGEPVYYRPVDGKFSGDVELEQYQGQDVLVWFEGTQPYGPGNYRGTWPVLDTSYQQIATIEAGNEMEADIHDVEITPANTALVMIYSPVRMDLTSLGGRDDAIVLEAVVQEVDIVTHDVLWEWHSLDEIPVSDMVSGDITQAIIDYIHINSLETDADGNLLMSMRNTSEMVKVDRTTGEVMWRLGGKSNDFTFTDGDDGPSLPHDARRLPDGTVSMFDNGNGHIPTETRGVRWTIDETAKTASRFKELKHDPKIFAPNQGRYQTLADDGQFLSWGGLGTISEYTSDGTLRFEATIPGGSYRATREDWHAIPATKPAIAITEGDPDDTVAVSWNGATDVATWQVLGGQRIDDLAEVASSPRTGFETSITVPTGSAFVQLVAKDGDGATLGSSEITPVSPWFTESGAPSVSGTYTPLAGDFVGPGADDIVWYAPGTGKDYLWTTGSGGGFTSSVLPNVNGTYAPLVGDFAGDGYDDIVWRRANQATAYLWTSDGTGGFTSTSVTVPKAAEAYVLPVEPGQDEILSYTPGAGGDAATFFLEGAAVTRPLHVDGTYKVSIGDFDGDGYPEVFWYIPGAGKDYRWRFDGEGGQTMGQISTLTPVNGSFLVGTGRYSGPGDERDDLLFYSPGASTSAESLWQGNADGTFTKRTDASSASGFPLRLTGETDYLYLLTPGIDGTIWQPATSGEDLYRVAANSAPAPGVIPVIGDFNGTDTSSILWYLPGGGAETLFTPPTA